jgi:hypothetical protein
MKHEAKGALDGVNGSTAVHGALVNIPPSHVEYDRGGYERLHTARTRREVDCLL